MFFKNGYTCMYMCFFLWYNKSIPVYSGQYKCESGEWKLYEDQCYYFSLDTKKRDNVECGDAKLATLDSPDVHAFILHNRNLSSTYWIGLQVQDVTSKQDWQWSDGSVSDFDRWANGHPNEHTCAKHSTVDQTWSSHSCTESLQFICKREILEGDSCANVPWNGYCYKLNQSDVTNMEACLSCYNDGWTLLSVLSEDEMDIIPGVGFGPFWLGIFPVKWDDDTTYNWHQWGEGGPSASDKCVYLSTDGNWYTAKCGAPKHNYICQKEAQIIQTTLPETTETSTPRTTTIPSTTTITPSIISTMSPITSSSTTQGTLALSTQSISTSPTNTLIPTTSDYTTTIPDPTEKEDSTALEIAFYVILTCDVLAGAAFVVLLVVYRRVKAQAEKNSKAKDATNTYYNVTELTYPKKERIVSVDNNLYMADSSTITHRKDTV